MYLIALTVELLSSVLLLLPLLLLAGAVRRLPGRPDIRRVVRTAKVAYRSLLAALPLVLAKLVVAVLLLRNGVEFAARPLLDLLVIGAPLVLTLLRTAPVLRGLVRTGGAPFDAAAPVTAQRRARLAAARFVLPARLLAVAGGASAVLALTVPTNSAMATVLGVFALVGLVVVVDVAQRERALTGRPSTLRWPRPLARLAAPLVLALAAAGCGAVGVTGSAMPAAMSMTDSAGHGGHAMPTVGPVRQVTDLAGGTLDGPVRRFTITASQARLPLASGATVDAWTFGGTLPGTPIRVRQGDVVEVTLVNHLSTPSVTIHWHGVDVPNAEDGVAGVTQDAVKPGGQFTYRFKANQVGTYWYHSHELANEQVTHGLFGLFVVDPADQANPADVDEALVYHDWSTDRGSRPAFGADDGVRTRAVAPGSRVRLRFVNADSATRTLAVAGGPWRLAALDGTDLHDPGELRDETVAVGGGGRADIALTMPDHPVRVSVDGAPDLGYVLSPDGHATIPAATGGRALDLTRYGTPTGTPFGAASRFDRTYLVDLDQGLGFHGGAFGFVFAMNGQVFPDVPMLTVREGDLVRVTFRNRTLADHPMHLHGHRVLLLSKDGVAVTGSPLWLDTVLVRPGETAEVAFRADNPGIWMDHCHDLGHAAGGMTMHLGYEGVRSPFTVGKDTGNMPE
ncbi:multicopper oxidase family protein [Solihabitans fulvus]|uniref:Multicopper oxidase family protein n=1 Tax=Solihabitans fulvus TaxID=1892852 RepID=A0A5B2XLQ2_9PSEU|nr:multicopper oxidase family protein [Solihabitans fulvus]KAA2263702.1 multicopper oxidase family protein [Solihabitans fulvus]